MPVRYRLLLTAIVISLCLLLSQSGRAFGQAPGHATRSTVSPRAQNRQSDFALKDKDRVVFFGDSITEQRLYTTYVEHYVLTHYPDRQVTFINTGWGGDKVTGNDCKPCAGVGGLARIKRDVIDHRPTVVTLLFGMNDGQYRDYDPAIMKVYEDGLTAIIRELKSKTSARIYVMTPTVYDGTRHTPWSKTDRYNDVLDRYSESAKAIAQREALPVIDLHALTTEALRQATKNDPAYTFAPDGVHPDEDGHLVMAAEILRAWEAPPAGLDLNRQVSIGENHDASLTISAPLPWPQPLPSEKLRKVSPQIMQMGEVTLRLAGLPSGKYRISVDGKETGEYSADQLASGIRLNLLSEKAIEESRAVADLVRKRANFFFMRWRQIELPLAAEYKSTASVVSSFDSLIAEMRDQARRLGASHNYRVNISRAR